LFAGLDQNPDRLTAIVAVVEPDNGLRIGGEKSFKAFFVAGRPRRIDRNPRERKILGESTIKPRLVKPAASARKFKGGNRMAAETAPDWSAANRASVDPAYSKSYSPALMPFGVNMRSR